MKKAILILTLVLSSIFMASCANPIQERAGRHHKDTYEVCEYYHVSHGHKVYIIEESLIGKNNWRITDYHLEETYTLLEPTQNITIRIIPSNDNKKYIATEYNDYDNRTTYWSITRHDSFVTK